MTDPRVREFLYVDVQRTRSLLAQINGGIAEEVRALSGNSIQADVKARILGIGGGSGFSREWGREESRSLQDIVFTLFEEAADEHQFISDISQTVSDPNAWERGDVHRTLAPAQLIRIRGDVQILDGELFASRMSRYLDLADALVTISPPPVQGPSGKRQREDALAKAKQQVMGGMQEAKIDGMARFVNAFLGDTIAMRVLPCGLRHRDFGFSGPLLGRKEYIQEEREHLFSRYGTYLTDWTCVLQVSCIPTRIEGDGQSTSNEVLRATGDVSRAGMERAAGELLTTMEQLGIVEGPRWPTISVTPLAVYRDVPRCPPGSRST